MITGKLCATVYGVSEIKSSSQCISHLHFGYTGAVASKSTPTPMLNTTAFKPIVLPDKTYRKCEWAPAMEFILDQLTKATTDRISSRPRPIPRIRPTNRKPTVTANKTHRTEMAMSESRALPVIGMGSVLVNIIAGRKDEGSVKNGEVVRSGTGAHVVLK